MDDNTIFMKVLVKDDVFLFERYNHNTKTLERSLKRYCLRQFVDYELTDKPFHTFEYSGTRGSEQYVVVEQYFIVVDYCLHFYVLYKQYRNGFLKCQKYSRIASDLHDTKRYCMGDNFNGEPAQTE